MIHKLLLSHPVFIQLSRAAFNKKLLWEAVEFELKVKTSNFLFHRVMNVAYLWAIWANPRLVSGCKISFKRHKNLLYDVITKINIYWLSLSLWNWILHGFKLAQDRCVEFQLCTEQNHPTVYLRSKGAMACRVVLDSYATGNSTGYFVFLHVQPGQKWNVNVLLVHG